MSLSSVLFLPQPNSGLNSFSTGQRWSKMSTLTFVILQSFLKTPVLIKLLSEKSSLMALFPYFRPHCFLIYILHHSYDRQLSTNRSPISQGPSALCLQMVDWQTYLRYQLSDKRLPIRTTIILLDQSSTMLETLLICSLQLLGQYSMQNDKYASYEDSVCLQSKLKQINEANKIQSLQRRRIAIYLVGQSLVKERIA